MKIRCWNWLSTLTLIATVVLIGSYLTAAAQSSAPAVGPDPKEIPIPPIKTNLGTMPGVKDLPARPDLPDVMTMNDGTKVKTPAQWQKRREEIKKILQYYAIGEAPPAPGNVKGEEMHSEMVLDGKVKYPAGETDVRSGPQAGTLHRDLYADYGQRAFPGDHFAELGATGRADVAAERAGAEPGQGRGRTDDGGWRGGSFCPDCGSAGRYRTSYCGTRAWPGDC